MRDLIARLGRRLDNMLARAVLRGVSADRKLQEVQVVVLGDEAVDGAEHVEGYGLTAHPLAGSEAVLAFLGGYREHPVALAVFDRRYRPKNLAPGEVQLYDHLGKFVHLREDGTLHIKAPNILIEATESAKVTAPVSRLHSTERTIVECAGHGEVWKADRKDTWTIGAVAGASHPINPPEIP